MKKIRSSLLAIALAIGVIGAFAFNSPSKNSNDGAIYDWTSELPDHENMTGTVEEARIAFECPEGTNILCAKGVLVSGTGPSPIEIKKP